jgi:hypothetical protein
MSQDIRISGRKIFISIPVQYTNPALRMSDGRVKLSSPYAVAIDKKPDSYIRSKDPGVQFGSELVNGEASIVLDLDELRLLGFRAARNVNKKAKQGLCRAAFSGIRTFQKDQDNG